MKNITGINSLVVYLKPEDFCRTVGIARQHLSKLIYEKKIDSAVFDKELYIPINLGHVSRWVFGIDPEDFKSKMEVNNPRAIMPAGGLLFKPISFSEWEARNARNSQRKI
jgi:hypothetical protein